MGAVICSHGRAMERCHVCTPIRKDGGEYHRQRAGKRERKLWADFCAPLNVPDGAMDEHDGTQSTGRDDGKGDRGESAGNAGDS